MALKYFLDRRKQKKNGGYSIRYHIYIKGLQTLFSTDIILKDEQWNGREIVNHPNSRNLNLYLTQNKIIALNEELQSLYKELANNKPSKSSTGNDDVFLRSARKTGV